MTKVLAKGKNPAPQNLQVSGIHKPLWYLNNHQESNSRHQAVKARQSSLISKTLGPSMFIQTIRAQIKFQMKALSITT